MASTRPGGWAPRSSCLIQTRLHKQLHTCIRIHVHTHTHTHTHTRVHTFAHTHTQVNSDPYKDGWMAKIKLSNKSDLQNLLDVDAYTKECESH